MCGIAGHFSAPIDRELKSRMVKAMTDRIVHRGPDGEGVWISEDGRVGFGHRRLSVIDIETGSQPMAGRQGHVIVFNGEIYNYKELKNELSDYPYKTSSDTEVILARYEKWGEGVVDRLRGMFAIAIFDQKTGEVFCARDPLGIKPFYYSKTSNAFLFGSEIKALLPHMEEIAVDPKALKEYFVFQLQMLDRTLFKGVLQLPPGHTLRISRSGEVSLKRYWKPSYERGESKPRSQADLAEELREVLRKSVYLHTRADVPIGAYVSGGVDSSFVLSMAREQHQEEMLGFTGKFEGYDGRFDESQYARDVGLKNGVRVLEKSITARDFQESFMKLVYHMDYPEAGPGAFPQFVVSELASQHRKVVLGGQGGDEIFGGYARYMVGLLENALGRAIDGRSTAAGNLNLSELESNLTVLKSYHPMMQGLFKEGLFGSIESRYFKLVSRAPDIASLVDLDALSDESPFDRFSEVLEFASADQLSSPMKCMMGFDLVSLLPGLLHVEDRVSMAWSLESRVPLVDREVIDFASGISESSLIPQGELKGLLRAAVSPYLPNSVLDRKDKMGFPTPLNIWMKNELKSFVKEIFATGAARKRDVYDPAKIMRVIETEGDFSRNVWGLMNIEAWLQTFVDESSSYRFRE